MACRCSRKHVNNLTAEELRVRDKLQKVTMATCNAPCEQENHLSLGTALTDVSEMVEQLQCRRTVEQRSWWFVDRSSSAMCRNQSVTDLSMKSAISPAQHRQ